jgi:hypothetical protein
VVFEWSELVSNRLVPDNGLLTTDKVQRTKNKAPSTKHKNTEYRVTTHDS